MIEVQVSGTERITDNLIRTVRDVPRLEPRTVGDIILNAARARTPVESGKLRASGSAQGMTVTFSAPYAAPIHWGWRARNIEPNPWLTKGAEVSSEAWLSAFAEALQTELDR